ncbi:unnamed protein product [Soboliphyme baturini]|uniref:Uncharacterized protein n=1 Tax=Soboliphyme baturini TaxID=241478 RepID=A0A183IAJ0_9BILA|nr:unnamed protein product [Soboliphyme baturini]
MIVELLSFGGDVRDRYKNAGQNVTKVRRPMVCVEEFKPVPSEAGCRCDVTDVTSAFDLYIQRVAGCALKKLMRNVRFKQRAFIRCERHRNTWSWRRICQLNLDLQSIYQ